MINFAGKGFLETKVKHQKKDIVCLALVEAQMDLTVYFQCVENNPCAFTSTSLALDKVLLFHRDKICLFSFKRITSVWSEIVQVFFTRHFNTFYESKRSSLSTSLIIITILLKRPCLHQCQERSWWLCHSSRSVACTPGNHNLLIMSLCIW